MCNFLRPRRGVRENPRFCTRKSILIILPSILPDSLTVVYKEIYGLIEKLKGLELKFDQSKAELSKKMETEYERLSKELTGRQEELEADRRKFELETNLMKGTTFGYFLPTCLYGLCFCKR